MGTFHGRAWRARWRLLAALVLLLGAATGNVMAQALGTAKWLATPLATQAVARDQAAARIEPQVVRSTDVAIHLDALTPSAASPGGASRAELAVQIPLFDGLVVTAVLRPLSTDAQGGSWSGSLSEVAGSQVVLVVANGVLSANLSTPGARYHIRFVQAGVYQVPRVRQFRANFASF